MTRLPAYVLLWVAAGGCENPSTENELTAGGIYSVDNGDGTFALAKLLVLDDQAAHVRIYAGSYVTRPTDVDPSSLTLHSIEESDDAGIGHLPLAREQFVLWRPQRIAVQEVSDDELEGYRMWEEAGGGLFR